MHIGSDEQVTAGMLAPLGVHVHSRGIHRPVTSLVFLGIRWSGSEWGYYSGLQQTKNECKESLCLMQDEIDRKPHLSVHGHMNSAFTFLDKTPHYYI